MELKLASYNLWFHKAYAEVAGLATQNELDIICLQECYTDALQPRLGSLSLADAQPYTSLPPPKRRNIRGKLSGEALRGNMGLAVYYNPKRLKALAKANYPLPLPWQERGGGRILQVVHFAMPQTDNSFLLVNIHLSALLASNRTRRQQMQHALDQLSQDFGKLPTILAGDFNYPVAGKQLRQMLEHDGFVECGLMHKARTHTSTLVKGKFDRIFISEELTERMYARLPFGSSDHAPIKAAIGF